MARNKQLLISPQINQNNFDLIRFILASVVILCHSYVILYGYEKFKFTEPLMRFSKQQISLGTFAVDMFFVISGFLIFRSFEHSPTTLAYWKKRILRIYPGFLVALLISYLLAGFIGSGQTFSLEGYKNYWDSIQIKKELAHLVTLQKPFQKVWFTHNPEPGLNDSVWTVHFEFLCYLTVPLFAWAGVYKKKILLIIAFCLAFTVLFLQQRQVLLPYSNSHLVFLDNPYFYPQFMTYFLAGGCFYFYKEKILRHSLLLAASTLLLFVGFYYIKAVDQVLPVAGSYVLFYWVYHPRIRMHHFARYGDFSYGIYLYGWPVQALLMYYFGQNLTPVSFFIAALPIACLMALFSWRCIEKPFLKLKGRRNFLRFKRRTGETV